MDGIGRVCTHGSRCRFKVQDHHHHLKALRVNFDDAVPEEIFDSQGMHHVDDLNSLDGVEG